MTGVPGRIVSYVRMHRSLVAPMLTGAALRLALMTAAVALTGTQVMTQGDTASYVTPGLSLLHGHFMSGGLPEIDRTPGYPLFMMVTGMIRSNVLAVVLAQIGVSVLSLLLVSRIAGRIFSSQGAGQAAAWLYAVEPLSILYTVRLMPETVFVLLLLCVIDRLLAFYASGKLKTVAAAGVLLAAATLVRPVSYYMVLAFAVGLAVTATRGRGYWWRAPVVLLVCTAPWLAAWQLRNYAETGYSGFSSIVEKNLYFYQSAEVTAELEGKSLGTKQRELGYPDDASYLAIHPEQRNWTQAQRLKYMRSQSVQILAAHRLLYLKTHMAGVAVVAFTPCATEFLQLLHLYPRESAMPQRILNEGVFASILRVLRAYPGVAVAMAMLEVILLTFYALAFFGLFRSNGGKVHLALLSAVALYFLLISGGAQAVGRYRLPVMPEICMLAGGGVAALKKSKGEAVEDLAFRDLAMRA